MEQKEILVKSSLDGTLQPSLFYECKMAEKRPLLVGLHTWSFNRFNQVGNMLPYAEKHGFNLLLPEFRGPNLKTNPEREKACGSKYVIADIKDAIDYCVQNYSVDEENIFILGASGGGQIALLMGAKFPELFKAVGAFVPVCDVWGWYQVCQSVRGNIEACCKDKAGMDARSPISYMDDLAKANVKIFHGKFDNFVPKEQSLDLYFKILEKHPSARVYLDIFDGKHEMDMDLAMHWILTQYEKKKIATVTK